MAFVIDGWALEIALKHHRKDFVELAILSRTAICCRVTPSQKAQVPHPTQPYLLHLFKYSIFPVTSWPFNAHLI